MALTLHIRHDHPGVAADMIPAEELSAEIHTVTRILTGLLHTQRGYTRRELRKWATPEDWEDPTILSVTKQSQINWLLLFNQNLHDNYKKAFRSNHALHPAEYRYLQRLWEGLEVSCKGIKKEKSCLIDPYQSVKIRKKRWTYPE